MTHFEAIIGIITILIGILSAIIILIARKKISNKLLLSYMHYSFLGITFLTLFSLWHTSREIFSLKLIYGPIIEIPEYLFVSTAYIFLLMGAYTTLKISKKFGFKDKGKKVIKSLKNK